MASQKARTASEQSAIWGWTLNAVRVLSTSTELSAEDKYIIGEGRTVGIRHTTTILLEDMESGRYWPWLSSSPDRFENQRIWHPGLLLSRLMLQLLHVYAKGSFICPPVSQCNHHTSLLTSMSFKCVRNGLSTPIRPHWVLKHPTAVSKPRWHCHGEHQDFSLKARCLNMQGHNL